MKKLIFLFAICSSLTLFPKVHVQPPVGEGAKASQEETNKLAWKIGLGAIIILATLGGVIASSATSSSPTYHVHQ